MTKNSTLNKDDRFSVKELFSTALFQFAVAGIAGSLIAGHILLIITGRIPAESVTLTWVIWGMVAGIILFQIANLRTSTRQKKAYVSAGGNSNVSLAQFMFGNMEQSSSK